MGLERTGGFETVAFCEIEDFPRRVLAKHWPGVPIYEDVRALTAARLAADGIAVDVICGGFPCQDISVAGKGAGLAGERSGLWREYARLIGELRPRYVLVENVAALLGRGLGDVLGDLATLGYDAEWHCIPAAAVGAPHRRDRVWIIATDTTSERRGAGRTGRFAGKHSRLCDATGALADATSLGQRKQATKANAVATCRQARNVSGGCSQSLAYTNGKSVFGSAITWPERTPWDVEPEMDRVVNGVPHRLVEDELRALGNAVVPQIPEIIGRAILEAERDSMKGKSA